MRHSLALLLSAALVGCGDPGADVDFGGEDLGADRFAIHSDDGALRMGLTDEFVYFALSDSVLAEARVEMAADSPPDGIGGTIAGIVKGGVSRALRFRARYHVDDIRDIRWENGRMVFDFVDPDRRITSLDVDDRPLDEIFTEEDVRAFGEHFRQVKRQRP